MMIIAYDSRIFSLHVAEAHLVIAFMTVVERFNRSNRT
jgi:hypothetical protein